MDKAAAEEKKRKSMAAESKKRPSSTVTESSDNKRIKLENNEPPTSTSASFLSAFDFTSLPASLITNLIVANLEAFTEPQLISMVNAYRQSRGMSGTPSWSNKADSQGSAAPVKPDIPRTSDKSQTPPTENVLEPSIKDEPVDPLKMDIDEEEMEFEPEKLNEAVSFWYLYLFTVSDVS